MKKQKIYLVLLEWSTDDDSGSDFYIFGNYDNAKDKFIELVEKEKDPNISWAYQAFNGTYDEEKRFEVETNIDWNQAYELFWDITDTWNYSYRTHIQLREMEIL